MRIRRRRGASAIEFVLVLPVFLAFVTGIVEASWFFFQRQVLVESARRAVRVSAGLPTDSDPEGIAEEEATNALVENSIDPSKVTIDATITSGADGDELVVSIAMAFDGLVGLVPMPDTIKVESSAIWYGGLYDT